LLEGRTQLLSLFEEEVEAFNYVVWNARTPSLTGRKSLSSKDGHDKATLHPTTKRYDRIHPAKRATIKTARCLAESKRFIEAINVSTRARNERKFEHWTELQACENFL
jgi:hypothetical protein